MYPMYRRTARNRKLFPSNVGTCRINIQSISVATSIAYQKNLFSRNRNAQRDDCAKYTQNPDVGLCEPVPHLKWNKSKKTSTYTWEEIRIRGTRNEEPRSLCGSWLASPINTRRVHFVVKYYSLIISDENLPTFTLRMSIRSASIKLPRKWQTSLLKMVISRGLRLYGK